MANNNGEPSLAPQPERWYELKLGSSFKDNPSTKFCTLRYEFKPASIDKSQPGSLHKNKDNRISVEFQNNQPGKTKVAFDGSSEDYKDHDGVLFFDGKTFRLERLHRAVNRLRHIRQPGEPSAAANLASSTPAGTVIESRSPPLGKIIKSLPANRTSAHPVPVEIERIDIGESPGTKPSNKGTDSQSVPPRNLLASPDPKSYEPAENIDIVMDDDDEEARNKANAEIQAAIFGFDINIPNQNDADDEIADVDVSDDEVDKGPNAAEALRAQVIAEEGQQHQQQQQTSTSSESSGSGSSGSGSGSGSSSSSDSDGSDNDSASSGGDIDI